MYNTTFMHYSGPDRLFTPNNMLSQTQETAGETSDVAFVAGTEVPPNDDIPHPVKRNMLHTLLINKSQAHLQAQLQMPHNRHSLNELRKKHTMRTYYCSKTEMYRALTKHSCTLSCLTVDQSSLGKRCRGEDDVGAEDPDPWPVELKLDKKRQIISEYIADTCADRLKFKECSFCGTQTNSQNTREYLTSQLDITYLLKLENILKEVYGIREISVAKKFNNRYITCMNCQTCIRERGFFKVPLYSYANGCWIGEIPDELKDLSFLEEQCISRARCTRCIIKLTPGKHSQYATHGNVCVFPQDPQNLLTVLPPPISMLYDEVAVIFVSSNSVNVTEKMLNESPLLVRRGKVFAALTWLKSHNVFYRDINISSHQLSLYPENSSPLNYPIQCIFDSGGEGTGYSGDGSYQSDANSTAFPSSNESIIQSSGVLDTDNQEISYKFWKLNMVKEILMNRKAFVKFPSSSQDPMKTVYNPNMYALLWPTLFPYGLGVFEEEIRMCKSDGFRTIEVRCHVNHVLNLANNRFKKHLTFPFVMMNLLQRKVSSFKSKLILKRSWFPRVVKAFQDIDPDALDQVKEKMLSKTPLGDSIQEKAVAMLLKYVNYISEDVSGSIGEVNRMRYEIRSIMRITGLPHIFLTINPADIYNPIMQVFGGRAIDLDKIFHDLSPGVEEFERMKCSVSNPAAAARAFDQILQSLINILFGMKRPGCAGVFGSVQSYYGVVEAQGRGSLHCHFFIWLKDGLDPFTVKEKLTTDPGWKRTFFRWMESIIYQDLPKGMGSTMNCRYKREPVMSRPSDPLRPGFDQEYAQDLNKVLNQTGQVHEHSYTCFKHLPFSTRLQRNDDIDCRFGLPRETVQETYVNDDGHIHVCCRDGKVNGYNDVIVYCLRCNMDCKYIGSGTMALAMTEYITNYIAKVSMDSSVIFTCLCAALKSMNDIILYKAQDAIQDVNEHARLLLLKICNGLIGKHELSGQQVLSFLQGIPNRYTNHQFENIWWTPVLKFIAPEIFDPLHNADEDYIILHESMLQSETFNGPDLPILVSDYVYRPVELTETSLWEFWTRFKTGRYKSKSEQCKCDDTNDCMGVCYRQDRRRYAFDNCHPKSMNSMVYERVQPITPILSGMQVPRNDGSDRNEADRYYIMILTLFKPWDHSPDFLKPNTTSWKSAFDGFWENLDSKYKSIINNFQSLYSCKDAAHNFSQTRRKRLKTLLAQLGSESAEQHERIQSRIVEDED